VEGVRWRDLDAGHRDAVMASARQSATADGARRTDHIAGLFLGMRGCLGIGGFVGDQLVAATVARTGYRPTVEGHVHPAYRGRGLGGAMLDWALARAGSNAVVTTRTLTPQAQRLFESRGLHLAAALERLWLPLDQPVETAPPPPGTALCEWDTGDGFGVYAEAFADLPSNPFADSEQPGRSREDWLEWTEDMEFLAACSLLARDADGRPVGFVTCDEGGPLQVGTVPAWWRRGLGRAMVTAAIARLRALPGRIGEAEVEVSADNAAAVRLFRDRGFQPDSRVGYFVVGRSG
jgi:ribosomal protein S18 acetylase RimI-like enzyme